MFSINGSFYRTLCKITDLLILNVLWLVGCIPIVTIGVSTASLYHCCIKCVRRDRSKLTKEFWRAYKLNLKSGIAGTLIFAVIVYLAVLYISFSQSEGSAVSTGFRILLYAFILLNSVTFAAFFPALSRFDLKLIKLLEMSFFMGMGHIFRSIIAVAMIAAAACLTLGSSLFILILPSPVALLSTFLYEPIFLKYMPSQQTPGVDSWYLEGKVKKKGAAAIGKTAD